MKAVAKAGRLWKGPSATEGQGVLLTEWEKPGWTYHAKGTSALPPPTAADFSRQEYGYPRPRQRPQS